MGASSAPEFPFPGGTAGKEPADPVAGKPGHFAWSRWVKEFLKRLDRDSVKNSGDTMTGPLLLRGEPSAVLEAVTKGYVDALLADAAFGDLTQEQIDAISSAAAAQIAAGYLPLTGGTLTGPLTVPAPTTDSHAAQRKTVTDAVATRLPLWGR